MYIFIYTVAQVKPDADLVDKGYHQCVHCRYINVLFTPPKHPISIS